ncbi:MAG TPA: hypothetical protein VJ725_09630 [Thermoanaerobaculia bacterium]|nr:hypothetical protein [Thermoanaerobaculia bacterium]
MRINPTIISSSFAWPTWSQSQIPPGFAHKSGHCYEWAVFLYESSQSTAYGYDKINFCVP